MQNSPCESTGAIFALLIIEYGVKLCEEFPSLNWCPSYTNPLFACRRLPAAAGRSPLPALAVELCSNSLSGTVIADYVVDLSLLHSRNSQSCVVVRSGLSLESGEAVVSLVCRKLLLFICYFI